MKYHHSLLGEHALHALECIVRQAFQHNAGAAFLQISPHSGGSHSSKQKHIQAFVGF